MEYAHRRITAAQIKLWSSAPVVIIPSPGANSFIEIINASVQFIPGTVAYTDPSPGQAPGFSNPPASFNLSFHALLDHMKINAPELLHNYYTYPATANLPNASGYGDIVGDMVGQPLTFGDQAGPQAELTLGDGTIDIWVLWTPLPAA